MTRAAIVILAFAGVSAAAAGALSALERDARMVVSVDGVPVRVAAGSSLESVLRRFDLDPPPETSSTSQAACSDPAPSRGRSS